MKCKRTPNFIEILLVMFCTKRKTKKEEGGGTHTKTSVVQTEVKGKEGFLLMSSSLDGRDEGGFKPSF